MLMRSGLPVSTEEQKQADGPELIDFCAECLNRFIEDHYGDEDGNVNLDEPLSLGFTFSYPCMCARARPVPSDNDADLARAVSQPRSH